MQEDCLKEEPPLAFTETVEHTAACLHWQEVAAFEDSRALFTTVSEV